MVELVVRSRGTCQRHRRDDNRGVQIEEYRGEVEDIVHQFGFHQEITTTALRLFKGAHTFCLDAKKLRYMQLSSSTHNRLLTLSAQIHICSDFGSLPSFSFVTKDLSLIDGRRRTSAAPWRGYFRST
jgi:hypothetical protein